jgi:Matrixin
LKRLLLGVACLAMSNPAVAGDSAYKWLRLEGHQVVWQAPSSGQTPVVRYRVLAEQAAFSGARNCSRMTSPDDLLARSGIERAALERELEVAFTMWQSAANITFRKAAADEAVDLFVGAQADPEGWAFADVSYAAGADGPARPISRALICLNPLKRWKVGFDGDLQVYDLRYTLAHEIGHAIGLDHPDGGSQIMGYRYLEHFRELQAGDIAGAVRLYGHRLRPGDSIARYPHSQEGPATPTGSPGFALGSTRALDANPR